MMSEIVQTEDSLTIDPYLSITDYKTVGNKIRLPDDTLVYSCGKPHSKNGIIIISDTLGWSTGRIRNFCDFFGNNDMFTVIPNFNSKGIEGETESFMSSSSIGDWYKSQTFDGNIKPVIKSLISFMKTQGVEKIALLGFAWGAWVAVNLLASDIAENFCCAALSSPTLELEETVYGGSLPKLLDRVTRPLLFLPTQGDTENYGVYLQLLKVKSSEVISYHDVEANFMLRGPEEQGPVKEAIQKNVIEIYAFFLKNFQLNDINPVLPHGEEIRETTNELEKQNESTEPI